MKKLFLIFSIFAVITTASAQSQLKTVRGKTKEGKSIVVRYYQGTFEDNIESVKYEVIDELQNSVKEQQNKVKNLQSRLENAERTARQLQQQINSSNGDKTTMVTQLEEQMAEIEVLTVQLGEKEGEVANLNSEIEALNLQISSLNRQIDSLNQQINLQGMNATSMNLHSDSLVKQINALNLQIRSIEIERGQLREENNRLNELIKTMNKKHEEPATPSTIQKESPFVGIEVRMGQFIYGHTVNESWTHDKRFSKHVSVYYGRPLLEKPIPVAIEVGFGGSVFSMSASKPACHLILDDQSDIDEDIYQAQYTYSDLSERLSLTYLDIPVRICIGQPTCDHSSVYAKVGLTPSILLHSSFSGEGTYTLKGYYEELESTWDQEFPELGFVSDANCYDEDDSPEMSSFMLWGNVAVGAYVPLGKSPVQLNFGVKVDYPFTSIGGAKQINSLPEGSGLLYKGNKVIIPSANIGIVYSIK